MRVSLTSGCFLMSLLVSAAQGQQAPGEDPEPVTAKVPPKRIFWIIPNYRTYPSLTEYKPISVKQKFRIAEQDSFDRGTVALAAAFAGEGQITHATPEFGQGVAGHARYFATSYADLVIGDFMTEAIYPTVLHQANYICLILP